MSVCIKNIEKVQKKIIKVTYPKGIGGGDGGMGTGAGTKLHFIPFCIVLIFEPNEYITYWKKN